MSKYICTDGNSDMEIEAESAQEAAQDWVDSGDWGERTETIWITVRVTNAEDPEESACVTITLDPEVPKCAEGCEHDWQSPVEVVGGLKDNPGVYGHGGGVVMTEVCSHCGCYKVEDTWAQNPENGEQGLESTEYREADGRSLAWVESQKRVAA